MTPDYCFRCSQYGHCSEDCPNFNPQMSRRAATVAAGAMIFVALLSLVGAAAQCADAFEYPIFGSFK